MSPAEHYQRQLDSGRLLTDEAQAQAIVHFQRLHERLLSHHARGKKSFLPRWIRTPPPAVSGLYLWGGVGRGKTWLMDIFFTSLPLSAKRRLHFHRFMSEVHQRLAALQGQANPLEAVADGIAGDAQVICLDEFQVGDIGDAMILGRLLSALFARGVTLVATSNCAPDALYPNGLQRTAFLPAIARIKAHTQVVELASNHDYRLRFLEQAETYHTPLDARGEAVLLEAFEKIAPEIGQAHITLDINGRQLTLLRHADSIAWASFATLCEDPRSQSDYLELARCYHTLLISGIPRLHDGQNDQARRFINLIDVLYDHNVTLIVSAAAPPEQLYQGAGLAFEFARTASRLREMQSRDWLGREHLA
jgi:cell division protein ZapE